MKKAIFELYEMVKETGNTEEYTKLLRQCDNLKQKLLGSFDTKQKELMEQIEDVQNDMGEERNRQVFKKAFCVACKLLTEAFYEEQKNEKM